MPEQTKPNVLIVDNDEGVVQAIATRLDSAGYLLHQRANGCSRACGIQIGSD